MLTTTYSLTIECVVEDVTTMPNIMETHVSRTMLLTNAVYQKPM